ncbi:hypothetical protein ACP4OV_018567 [Aristida adscensionis]
MMQIDHTTLPLSTFRVMEATSSSSQDARTSSSTHESLPQPPPAPKEAWVDIEEMISKATARFETQISTKVTRIYKFPRHLRGMGGPDGRYIVPSVVAIGPYHHGRPHLQEMEEVKKVAAHQFCRYCGCSVEEVYEKIVSVAGDARRCYTVDDDTSLVATLGDTEFTTMMFLDGCFLLQLMVNYQEPPIIGRINSSGPNICKDIFMLENQIPWLVIEVLMEFFIRPVNLVKAFLIPLMGETLLGREEATLWSTRFQRSLLTLQAFLMKCRHRVKRDTPTNDESDISNEDPKPPHLLGLLWFTVTLGMPSQRRRGDNTYIMSQLLSKSSSAVYLAQIGIKLSASRAAWFADMAVREKPFCGELSLSPLLLDGTAACWLVNLAALEAAEATNASSVQSDGHVVISYISMMAMLMDREEDVQELRAKGVLSSRFSNAETLDFFKGLAQHMRRGFNYHTVMRDINEYMSKRPVRIAVYSFVYKYRRLIVAVMSIASVLVGIFKALYSLKKP